MKLNIIYVNVICFAHVHDPKWVRLRLHERGFISIRFHDFKTAPKLMRFGSVYTEPFSYSLRHAEVITDQRDPSKKESTILFFSSWRNVDLFHDDVELLKSN